MKVVIAVVSLIAVLFTGCENNGDDGTSTVVYNGENVCVKAATIDVSGTWCIRGQTAYADWGTPEDGPSIRYGIETIEVIQTWNITQQGNVLTGGEDYNMKYYSDHSSLDGIVDGDIVKINVGNNNYEGTVEGNTMALVLNGRQSLSAVRQ